MSETQSDPSPEDQAAYDDYVAQVEAADAGNVTLPYAEWAIHTGRAPVPGGESPMPPVVPPDEEPVYPDPTLINADGALGWWINPKGQLCAGPTIERPETAEHRVVWMEARANHQGIEL